MRVNARQLRDAIRGHQDLESVQANRLQQIRERVFASGKRICAMVGVPEGGGPGNYYGNKEVVIGHELWCMGVGSDGLFYCQKKHDVLVIDEEPPDADE